VRETVSKSTMLRRESISEKIEGALQDAEGKKVAIGGSARGIAQQVLNGRKGQDNLYGSGALDLTFLARPMARTTFFADLEAIAGPGPDRKLGSLSRLNADVETLGGQDEKLTLREVWLGFQFFNDRLDAFVGKLYPTNYFDRNTFANDETTQFLNAALVNNAMLKQPPNGPGLVTRWDAGRDLGFSLGGHGTNDFEKDLWSGPFIIGEVDYHLSRFFDGNYRLWARVGRLPDDQQTQTWGMGVSLDQLLTPQLGVFARAGFSDAEGISQTSYAVSTGLQFTSPWASRPRDRLGAGYSFISEPVGDEHLVELYYNLFLTERLSFIGNVEWLISGPNQVTGQTNNNVVVPGVRAVVSF
jgi:carbohydrate-selective porin OprB